MLKAVADRTAKRFLHASLDNYRPESDSERAALDATRSWCEAVIAGTGGPMLALIGPPGTGKSHLFYGAVKELVAARKFPHVRAWYRLGDELRYGDGKREPQEVRAALLDSRIVMIDEIRPTSGTNFDDTELAKLACAAYDNETPVFVTSNVFPLENVMGEAAATRFVQVVVRGRNRRPQPVVSREMSAAGT